MPDTTPSSPASAALSEIRGLVTRRDQMLARMNAAQFDDAGSREVEERFTAAQDKLAARVPSLVAAIEIALELAADWERKADEADDRAEAASGRGDKDASLMLSGRGQALHDCSFALRAAITRELTKGETTP